MKDLSFEITGSRDGIGDITLYLKAATYARAKNTLYVWTEQFPCTMHVQETVLLQGNQPIGRTQMKRTVGHGDRVEISITGENK